MNKAPRIKKPGSIWWEYTRRAHHATYPFGDYVSGEKGLENINKYDKEYIDRAKACKNNKEFMNVFKEYLTRLGQAACKVLSTKFYHNSFVKCWP